MTVATETNKVSYSGSTANALPVNFKFPDSGDLKVWQTSGTTTTELAETTDYTVSGAGEDSGGTVTLLSAPLATDTITIMREVGLTQDSSWEYIGDFNSEQLELDLDTIVMMIQQLKEGAERALTAPVYSIAGINYTLPTPEAGKVVGVWDETASVMEIGPSVSDISSAQSHASSAAASESSASASAAAAAASAAEAAVSVPKVYLRGYVAGILSTIDPLVEYLSGVNGDVVEIGVYIPAGTSATVVFKNGGSTMATLSATSTAAKTTTISNQTVTWDSIISVGVSGVSGDPERLTYYLIINPA
jgi:hypothetical protein